MLVATREIRGCRHGLPQKGGCDLGSHPETREAVCDPVLRRDGQASVGNHRAEPAGGPTGARRPDVGTTQRQVSPLTAENHGGGLRHQMAGGLSRRAAAARPPEAVHASSYQSNLAKHILPFFGAMPLRDVTLPHVREFIKALLGKQLAAKTIGNVILILKQRFKHAVQWGFLDSNPVQYVELPRGEEKEMDILTPAEIRRLLEAQEEPLKTLLLTATLTGMRQGELFGLQWGRHRLRRASDSRPPIAVAWRARHAEVPALPARHRHGTDAGGGAAPPLGRAPQRVRLLQPGRYADGCR